MEVIFPWERDDIIVRSTADDLPEGESDGEAFAAMLASVSAQADADARIRTLASGVRTVVRSTEMTTDEVLARVRSEIDAAEETSPD